MPPISLRRACALAIGFVLVAAALALGFWLLAPSTKVQAEQFAYSRTDNRSGELPKLWRAPAFEFVDERARRVSLSTLSGQPWIANFIFTQCTTVCPVLTSHLVALQRELVGEAVRFVSFSVDPKHDSPAVLAAYAQRWNAGERRWTLLSTDEKHLPDAIAGFRVVADASGDPNNPIIHSSLFMLVDAQSWVRATYDSNDDEARARLVADVRALAVSPSANEASEPSHAPVHVSLGCQGCHADPRIAPPLARVVLGSERIMSDGQKLTVDRDYIRRSLLEPGSQVVAGYVPLMPSYAGKISEAQLTKLVEELAQLADAPAQVDERAPSTKVGDGQARAPSQRSKRVTPKPTLPSAAVALVKDPVCQMDVRADPSAPKATHQNQDYYFCSESCRERFQQRPEKFIASSP